jgi:hypothetical protein
MKGEDMKEIIFLERPNLWMCSNVAGRHWDLQFTEQMKKVSEEDYLLECHAAHSGRSSLMF